MNLRLNVSTAVFVLMAAMLSAQLPKEAMSSATQLLSSKLTASGPPSDMSSKSLPGGLRVDVKRAGQNPYVVQVMSEVSQVPIHTGDVVFVTFESRSPSLGGGLWSMYAQRNVAPWIGYFSAQGLPGNTWHRYNVKWTSDHEIAPGSMAITFHVASRAQEIEFRDFSANNLGHYSGALPFTPLTYPGREASAPWRKEANEKIDRYRKADVLVHVTDSKGKPVKGAKVHVKQLRHAYEFGSFVESSLLASNPDGEQYRKWFLSAYNKATTPMYWADWGWEDPNSQKLYKAYPVWLKEHSITTKAHVLIYPGWQFMPTRLKKYENDPKVLWAEMDKHIREKIAFTKPFGFVSWDVTNETRDLRDLPKIFGSEEIYVRLFKLMHELDPRPTLYLNENTILTNGGKTESQQAEFERMLRYLLKNGAPLQGIGMQGHFGEVMTAPPDIWRIVDRFAKFGLPIQITEFDLPIADPQAQADYTRDLLTAWFAHPATTGFTMWGFWEGSMWQPAGALVDKNWKVKPNGQAWLDLVKKRWWSDTTLTTDRFGNAKYRVFKGDFEFSTGKFSRQVKIHHSAQVRMVLK